MRLTTITHKVYTLKLRKGRAVNERPPWINNRPASHPQFNVWQAILIQTLRSGFNQVQHTIPLQRMAMWTPLPLREDAGAGTSETVISFGPLKMVPWGIVS